MDVVVIGGGPAGTSAALHAARNGANVVLFEEHDEIGKPRHCAGLVSGEGLKLISMPCRDEYIENEVRRALIVFDQCVLELKKVGEPVYVINREVFDKALAELAVSHGVKVRLGCRVEKVSKKENGFIVKTKEGAHSCKVVVDGEGAFARLATSMGIPGPSIKIPALQYEVKCKNPLDGFLVIIDDEWAPGFFSWVIPLGDDKLRVGLASTIGHCDILLTRILKRHPLVSKTLGEFKVERRYGGLISIGPPKRTCVGSFLVVGDAAGQTKPLTGGGIVYSAMCGSIAGKIAAEASLRNFEACLYEKCWRRLLGKEERVGVMLRDLLMKEEVGGLLKLMSRMNIPLHMERAIHYEFHITSMFRSPRFLILLLTLLTFLSPVKAFKYLPQVLLPK